MNTFAIIGAGFSGTVAAIEFLNRATGDAQLVMINRSGSIARGLAYGTNSPQHLLNVPAGNMTALADEPNSFLEYCRKQGQEVASNSFISRKTYGDYLEKLLDNAITTASPRVRTKKIIAEVLSLTRSEQGAAITLSNGETLQANQVALAFGHFPPANPPALEAIVKTHFFQRDPWQQRAPSHHSKSSTILLIGGGLTAIDVITNLIKSGHTGKIYMLSRRGILPQTHRVSRSNSMIGNSTSTLLLNSPPSIAKYFRIIRQEINKNSLQGIDWRDIIASIRPITSELWTRLSDYERRKFLRHAQSYWDAHRHRVAPETYQILEAALAGNQVVPIAGRINSIEVKDSLVTVDIKSRRKEVIQKVTASLIINCTGPSSDLRKSTDPLINQLMKDDLISADTLGLGLRVEDTLFVKNSTDLPSNWLSYVGPMLKADRWESTAVPELREVARSLAIKICEIFEQGQTPPTSKH